MEIWTGSINLLTSAPLEGIRLSTPATAPAPPSYILSHLTSSLADTSLSLITLIDPSKIPLYLAAGPSLEVTTCSSKSEDYFRRIFLAGAPRGDSEGVTMEQSRIAVLVSVDRERLRKENSGVEIFQDEPATKNDWKITELVIYGAISYRLPSTALITDGSQATARTPPKSSLEILAPSISITVHALPLSSHHGFGAAFPETKVESPLTPSAPVFSDPSAEAYFIAPNPQEILNPSISQSAKKRRADALDAVVEKRKKIRVSASQPPPLTLFRRNSSTSIVNVKREPGVEISGNVSRRVSTGSATGGIMTKWERERDRSPSPTRSRRPSVSVAVKGRRASQSQSQSQSTISRRNSIHERERESQSLSRPVSSSSSMTTTAKALAFGEKDSGKEGLKEEVGEVEARNRELLAKIVLAGMKSSGIRDYRSRARSVKFEDGAGAEKENLAVAEREKEEYKGLYHMTVRAAVFALRGVMNKQEVKTETMKSVVDRLLGVFCGGYGGCAVEAVRAVDGALALEVAEFVDGE
ncbi:hypothetical protein RUND412_006382 [Rhizina undulata]